MGLSADHGAVRSNQENALGVALPRGTAGIVQVRIQPFLLLIAKRVFVVNGAGNLDGIQLGLYVNASPSSSGNAGMSSTLLAPAFMARTTRPVG